MLLRTETQPVDEDVPLSAPHCPRAQGCSCLRVHAHYFFLGPRASEVIPATAPTAQQTAACKAKSQCSVNCKAQAEHGVVQPKLSH